MILVKAKDETRMNLATAKVSWELDQAYTVTVTVDRNKIVGFVGGRRIIEAEEGEYTGGGVRLLKGVWRWISSRFPLYERDEAIIIPISSIYQNVDPD